MDYQEILLTQGMRTKVDTNDFEWLSQWKWYYDKKGYAIRTVYENGKQVGRIGMHRQIMATPHGLQTDHVNRERLDNRRANLRICTVSQNQANAGVRKDNTSGFRGVWLNNKKWSAAVMLGGKRYYLGSFIRPEDAARAQQKMAKELYGVFAPDAIRSKLSFLKKDREEARNA